MVLASYDKYFPKIVWRSSKVGQLTYLLQIFLFFLIIADLSIALENLLIDNAYAEAGLDFIDDNYEVLGDLYPSLSGLSKVTGTLNGQHCNISS